MDKRRRPSPRISPSDHKKILARLAAGEFQHRIAAEYGVNQGRISEIKTGKRAGGHHA